MIKFPLGGSPTHALSTSGSRLNKIRTLQGSLIVRISGTLTIDPNGGGEVSATFHLRTAAQRPGQNKHVHLCEAPLCTLQPPRLPCFGRCLLLHHTAQPSISSTLRHSSARLKPSKPTGILHAQAPRLYSYTCNACNKGVVSITKGWCRHHRRRKRLSLDLSSRGEKRPAMPCPAHISSFPRQNSSLGK